MLKGYPRLSETFIAQEILGLERRGLDIRIVSLRRPTDAKRHPVHDEIKAPVRYLPEYLHDEPGRLARAWRRSRRLPGYRAARAAWLKDLRRDFTRNRIRRFGQAMVLAGEIGPEVGHLHAHFLHTPASVTRYASLMTGLPWTCSAHAKDVWTTPAWEIADKLRTLDWLVTCTEAARAHLAALAPDPQTVRLVYHGLDFGRFPPPPGRDDGKTDGSLPAPPAALLSVGRIVPKKGFDILIEALGALAHLNWRWVHIGGGDRRALEARAQALGIAERIVWRGAQAQRAVLAALGKADIFVLPSRIAGDGDRDGLPNVLMEAQSQALVCLSSDVSGIPELIEDGATGVLVPPGDPAALAGALAHLIDDPGLRARLGSAGLHRLQARFGQDAGLDKLAALFGLASPGEAPSRTTRPRVAAS
ncbi:MAG TPA: glycosyltransferase family 4 protein [Alphaproteobacteria bacterium]|nr:glycosyltransferase family 4 protein [Alphaproteobacteria bacterium]